VPPRLRLIGVTKCYAATLANDAIDLIVAPGSIHAVLGENGAGKSTLVKSIYGVVQPDSGSIEWDGAPVTINSPNVARKLGIGMVFQHFSLFESLTVTENIALGLGSSEPLGLLARRIAATARSYGLGIEPARHISHLSVGERQRVEIVRCLLGNPRLLIMDEPTSVLTPQEVDGLFDVLRRLAAEGCSVLYISHKLDEVAALCDAATVLRGGRVVGQCDPRITSPAKMAELMTGTALPECRRKANAPGVAVLQVQGLTLPPEEPFGTTLRDVHLTLHAGEILGIAGVAGNGQTELLAVLSGERRSAGGTVRLAGREISAAGPERRRRAGLAFIPEERLGRGAVAELSLADNALLTCSGRGLVRGGFIFTRAVRAYATTVFELFRVVASGIDARADSLSGGNMQKFIIGREVGAAPRVLLAAHPTWGVDIGAALSIRQQLMTLTETGTAILVVSEDLAELFEISDRIAVLSGGRLSKPEPVAGLTLEAVGRRMGGAEPVPEPERVREVAHAA